MARTALSNGFGEAATPNPGFRRRLQIQANSTGTEREAFLYCRQLLSGKVQPIYRKNVSYRPSMKLMGRYIKEQLNG
jgi:hypothetical protein